MASVIENGPGPRAAVRSSGPAARRTAGCRAGRRGTGGAGAGAVRGTDGARRAARDGAAAV